MPVFADGKARDYVPLAHASRPWRICTLLPHGIDRYWWGVAWGLDEEARRQGVQLGIYEAGGYQFPAMQRANWPAASSSAPTPSSSAPSRRAGSAMKSTS